MVVRHHVLVVEDHIDSAEMLATFLRALGHGTMVAHDVDGALAILTTQRPTLAVIDIGLGPSDGFTLAKHLRATFGNALPIIALSAYSAPEFRARAKLAGIDTYLTKPVDLVAFESMLASLR